MRDEKESVSGATREWDESCVRLFLSVDLVGSTAFKNSFEADVHKGAGPRPWVNVFEHFYKRFTSVFDKKLGDSDLSQRADLKPKLVKTLGDELLLVVEVLCAQDAALVVNHFAKGLVEYTKTSLKDHPALLLKGTAWLAGFPLNNHRVPLVDEGGGPPRDDYIGPSMDTGFRIAKFATPSKLVVAVDLAVVLLTRDPAPKLYLDGTQSLRGVLGGRPYPIFWLQVKGPDKALHDAELALLAPPHEPGRQLTYCDEYLKSCDGSWLIRPYFKNDDQFKERPKWHDLAMQTGSVVDQHNFEKVSE